MSNQPTQNVKVEKQYGGVVVLTDAGNQIAVFHRVRDFQKGKSLFFMAQDGMVSPVYLTLTVGLCGQTMTEAEVGHSLIDVINSEDREDTKGLYILAYLCNDLTMVEYGDRFEIQTVLDGPAFVVSKDREQEGPTVPLPCGGDGVLIENFLGKISMPDETLSRLMLLLYEYVELPRFVDFQTPSERPALCMITTLH